MIYAGRPPGPSPPSGAPPWSRPDVAPDGTGRRTRPPATPGIGHDRRSTSPLPPKINFPARTLEIVFIRSSCFLSFGFGPSWVTMQDQIGRRAHVNGVDYLVVNQGRTDRTVQAVPWLARPLARSAGGCGQYARAPRGGRVRRGGLGPLPSPAWTPRDGPRGTPRTAQTGSSGRCGPSGSSTSRMSPGRTSPPCWTMPMIPALRTSRPWSSRSRTALRSPGRSPSS